MDKQELVLQNSIRRNRIMNAIYAIHQLVLWESESLPDGALIGTGLTLEASLLACEEALEAEVSK